MEIHNEGTVIHQQIVGDHATGYFIASEKAGIREIESVIQKHCTKQEAQALLPVLSELDESVKSGTKEAKNSKVWIDKMQKALSAVGSMATISNAAWWPLLVRGIENFVKNL